MEVRSSPRKSPPPVPTRFFPSQLCAAEDAPRVRGLKSCYVYGTGLVGSSEITTSAWCWTSWLHPTHGGTYPQQKRPWIGFSDVPSNSNYSRSNPLVNLHYNGGRVGCQRTPIACNVILLNSAVDSMHRSELLLIFLRRPLAPVSPRELELAVENEGKSPRLRCRLLRLPRGQGYRRAATTVLSRRRTPGNNSSGNTVAGSSCR